MSTDKNAHEILVWGPAAEGERSSSGRVLRAGWVWTCSCGASNDGYLSEDDAEVAAGGHEVMAGDGDEHRGD